MEKTENHVHLSVSFPVWRFNRFWTCASVTFPFMHSWKIRFQVPRCEIVIFTSRNAVGEIICDIIWNVHWITKLYTSQCVEYMSRSHVSYVVFKWNMYAAFQTTYQATLSFSEMQIANCKRSKSQASHKLQSPIIMLHKRSDHKRSSRTNLITSNLLAVVVGVYTMYIQ